MSLDRPKDEKFSPGPRPMLFDPVRGVLLHPPLASVGVPIGTESGRQRKDAAFGARTLPLPCVSTASGATTAPFRCGPQVKDGCLFKEERMARCHRRLQASTYSCNPYG